jgi:hypothetical protein
MDIADVDFDAVLKQLRSRFRDTPLEGAILGRTALRDAVAEFLGCSLLQAEQIVDTLVADGAIQLVRSRDMPPVWQIRK